MSVSNLYELLLTSSSSHNYSSLCGRLLNRILKVMYELQVISLFTCKSMKANAPYMSYFVPN